ncbi:MAG: transposase [Thermodesulfobacteriota bacterium]
MKYNPDIHHRKSIRLKEYDYSQLGAYFITICTHNKELYFEQYPELKQIVSRQWQEIPDRYTNIQLDEFIVMPNHIHGIMIVGATLAVAQKNRAGARPAPTIGEIIGTFKSRCVHNWLKYIKENRIDSVGKFWQRNYYEHIIRNQDELNKIREYIQNNPLEWHLDRENPQRIADDLLEDEIFHH